MAKPGLFFIYFRLLEHIKNFKTNMCVCEKMSIQYTVLGFKLTTFGT